MRTSSSGQHASTSTSDGVLNGPELGWHGWSGDRPTCSPTGSFFMGKAGCWEPYELRGSRTVLGARGGEIPRATRFPITADDSARRRRQRRRKLIQNARLRQHVTEMLARWWSPEQIAGRLKLAGGNARLCHETIYQSVYSPEGQALALHRHLLRARLLCRRRFGRKPCSSKPRAHVGPSPQRQHPGSVPGV